MKQSTATNILFKFSITVAAIVVIAFLVSCSTTKTQKTLPHAPADASPGIAELAMVGEWTIAIEPTADILARAQFGTKQTFTVKAGATSPVTNLVTNPFDQKKYDESNAFWTANLNKPGLKWQIILKSDNTGLQITHDENSSQSLTNSIKWDCHGAQVLHLEYPEQKRFNNYHCRIVSSNEWHYPMEPLGGYFVMRRM